MLECPAWWSGRTSPSLYGLLEGSLLGYSRSQCGSSLSSTETGSKWALPQQAVPVDVCSGDLKRPPGKLRLTLYKVKLALSKGSNCNCHCHPRISIFQILGSGHCREAADRQTDPQLPRWDGLPSSGYAKSSVVWLKHKLTYGEYAFLSLSLMLQQKLPNAQDLCANSPGCSLIAEEKQQE